MIEEKHIDVAIELLGDEALFRRKSANLITTQPSIIAYLESEGFQILSNEEKDLMWYCILVIIEAIIQSEEEVESILLEEIEEAEEMNYSKVGDKNLKFSDVADIMFDGYEEEDLLAFVEDTLIPDEEEFPTPVGRKVLFISLKTLIDALRQC
jgi:hypothetical protein